MRLHASSLSAATARVPERAERPDSTAPDLIGCKAVRRHGLIQPIPTQGGRTLASDDGAAIQSDDPPAGRGRHSVYVGYVLTMSVSGTQNTSHELRQWYNEDFIVEDCC